MFYIKEKKKKEFLVTYITDCASLLTIKAIENFSTGINKRIIKL